MGNFTTLRLWGTISYTDTLSTITTINNTHILAWELFGQQNIGQTMCFFPLGVTEVNVNLATTYFGRQNQKGQTEFWKLLAKMLIFNTYYDEEQDKTPDKKRKQWDFGHCLIMLPKGKNFQAQELSQENVSICNTNALHVPNECGYTASVPQESISVQNVLYTIWHVLKTIFQH